MNDAIESKNFYNKIYEKYNVENYFSETVIEVSYSGTISKGISNERLYKINNITAKASDSIDPDLNVFLDNCNKELKIYGQSTKCQLFYLYKELLQFFTSDKQGYNFFRGQSNNYPLKPGILRDNVQNDYRKEFENLYQKISNEFPDKIDYYELNDTCEIENREYQLSLLQHYGLKTSLLDITSNPYIALLFMLSDQQQVYKEPTLFLFKINEKEHREKHLFTEVRKSKNNERIIAQKGAFLNYDKIFNGKSFDVKRIDCVKVILKFDENEYNNLIESELKMLEELGDSEIKDDIAEQLETYQHSLFNGDDGNATKEDCLLYIKKEMLNKLREYHYFEEDLFPDFERRIQYLSEKYESLGAKKIFSE